MGTIEPCKRAMNFMEQVRGQKKVKEAGLETFQNIAPNTIVCFGKENI